MGQLGGAVPDQTAWQPAPCWQSWRFTPSLARHSICADGISAGCSSLARRRFGVIGAESGGAEMGRAGLRPAGLYSRRSAAPRAGCAVSAFGHDPSRWPLGRPRRSARHAVAGAQARARKPAPHHRSGRSRTGAIQRITSPGRRRETTLRRSQRYERSLTEVRSLRVASRRGAGPAARSRCAGGDDTDARQRWTLRSWGKGEGTFG